MNDNPDSVDMDPTRITLTLDPKRERMRGIATHGWTPFDVPYVSQITLNLWQGGCQDGLQLPDEIVHVVSLYPWERYFTHEKVLSELYVRMYDSTDQGFEQIDELARYVNTRRQTGIVLVHCQAGLNRSSLVAARALILAGMPPKFAIDLIRKQRSPACLCNPSFYNWLLENPT
jgi:protein-tyrosine phosphatase